jgi:hypothetical protein
MYGWILHVNTYSPGVVKVTESPPFLGSVLNGIPAAPVGKIRLVRVWTVLEFPEKFILAPGVTIASDRVPAMSTPVSNQRPGVSVIEKSTSFEPARLPLTGSTNAIRNANVDATRPLLVSDTKCMLSPLLKADLAVLVVLRLIGTAACI